MKPLLKRQLSPRAVLAVLVLALLASVAVGGTSSRSPAAPETRSDTAAAPARAALPAEPALETELLRPRGARAPQAVPDLFQPPDIASTPAAPAERSARAPEVPPLPFTYLGRMIEDERTTVFVSRDDDSYVLAAGNTIARLYRVELIGPDAVTFVHLPSGKRQTLALPGSN